MQRLFVTTIYLLFISHYTVTAQVGIHTTTPAAGVSLHIKDDFESIRLDGSSPFLSFYNGTEYRGYLYMTGDNMYLYNRTAGSLFFGTNNSLKLMVNSTGDIGMGTSVPKSKLHVADGILSGSTFNGNTIAGFEKSSGNGYLSILTNSGNESGILFGDQTSGQRGGVIYNNGGTPDGLQFRTNGNTARMVIDNVGDVGIGLTNPGRPLDVKSRNGGDEYGIRLFRSGSSVDWEMSVFGGNFNFFYDGALNATARITTSGVYQSSDRRLKQNIRDYKAVLPRLKDLSISSYQYIADKTEHRTVIGLIAQDVANLYPEIVRVDPDRAGNLYYSIDYSKTGVLALKAIQELQEQIAAKDDTNEALEKQLQALTLQNKALQQRLGIIEAALERMQ